MLQNLIAGSILVIITVIIHGVGLLTLSAILRVTVERARPHDTLAGTVVTMVGTVLGLFFLHTLEIWTWALALIFVGAFSDMTSALSFSTLSFSTLGAEALSTTPEWRLFGSFEGVNGFLLIGWSTAYLIPAWSRYGPFHEERGF
jgi:Na+/melibiose symporter-like transporter